MNKTLEYYRENTEDYINKTINADVSKLHSIFRKHINDGESVLDVGFGSGRDMLYLSEFAKLKGIDGNKGFVDNMSTQFEVRQSILPSIAFKESFDTVVSVATIMHLSKEDILKTLDNLRSRIKPGGKLILSYSTKGRPNEVRHFEELSPLYISNICSMKGFALIEADIIDDGLSRDIQWVTQVFYKY